MVCFLIHVASGQCENASAASFMCFIFSFSSQKDAAEAGASVRQSAAVPPPAQPEAPPVKEEPKEPVGPSVEPVTSISVSPKPAQRTALAVQPEPELRPEHVLKASGKPQQGGADEEKPAEVAADGHERREANEDPVCDAEKQLWATVEETTVEGGKEHSEDEDKKQEEEEGAVTGG